MWLKFLLLVLYLLFLFLLSRLLEAASWYDTGTFFTSFAVLDPISLSVRKLKQLLDDRGVSYAGVVEKQELIDLVSSSGAPTTEELVNSLSTPKTSPESTQFTCGSHFYEEVEDTKDSAWLVQVVMDDSDAPFLLDKSWKEIKWKVSNFGIRTGVFKCSLDKRLCSRKGWTSPRLILALPRGHKAKEDVILHNYLLPTTSVSVLQWVKKHLSSRVKEIASNSELEQWLTYTQSGKTELRVILFSLLKSCPMFLSALAIKFNGRVKFATVDSSKISSLKKVLNSRDLPVYLVVTPEKKIVYGQRRGENYNFKSMELFLRTYVPEMNDIFLWSLLLVNALAGFELFFMHSHVWKHFLLYVVCVVKYNCALFLLWLLVLALYQFPFMQTCTNYALKGLRVVSDSSVSSILRDDFRNFYSHTFLLVTFVMFSSISGFILRKFKWLEADDTAFFSNWWAIPADTLISTYFFQQRVSLTRPATSQDHDLEVGIELLIERMAVPNLWLRPVISMDYFKELPTWRYCGWCEADDVDNRGDSICSSDDELSSLLPTNSDSKSTSSKNFFQFYSGCANTSSQDPPVKLSAEPIEVDDVSPINANIPNKIKDRAPKGMLEFRECSICLENYKYSEVLCGLPCGHNFHMNCIMSWLSRDNHCCPICRWPSYKWKDQAAHMHSQ